MIRSVTTSMLLVIVLEQSMDEPDLIQELIIKPVDLVMANAMLKDIVMICTKPNKDKAIVAYLAKQIAQSRLNVRTTLTITRALEDCYGRIRRT